MSLKKGLWVLARLLWCAAVVYVLHKPSLSNNFDNEYLIAALCNYYYEIL